MPVYLVEVGTRFNFDGNAWPSVTDGFADVVALIQPANLQMVTNPLTLKRSYTGENMPIVTFDMIDDANYIETICSPKALGTGHLAALDRSHALPCFQRIAQMLGKRVRDDRQLTRTQSCQYQMTGRKAAFIDLPGDNLAAITIRADGNLKRDGLLMVKAAAQEFETVAFDHGSQFDGTACQIAIQQLPPTGFAAW